MKRISLLTGLFALVILPLAAAAGDAVLPDQLKWSAPGTLMKGAEIAVVSGDPSKEAPYVLRLRIPAGFKILPHSHPNDENVTVLSGMLHTGMGDAFDEKATEPVPPGGFVRRPAGMHHFIWVSEDTVLQLHGVGPSGITYVNPADDPRKK
jgi:hypothetical protein